MPHHVDLCRPMQVGLKYCHLLIRNLVFIFIKKNSLSDNDSRIQITNHSLSTECE